MAMVDTEFLAFNKATWPWVHRSEDGAVISAVIGHGDFLAMERFGDWFFYGLFKVLKSLGQLYKFGSFMNYTLLMTLSGSLNFTVV